MTTPDPADNGSEPPRDQSGRQSEGESALTEDPEQWASAVDPASPPPLPPPLDNSRSLGDQPIEDPTPRTMLNGTPLAGPSEISEQAAGSSPDETPTAPQAPVAPPDRPAPGALAPIAPPPGPPTSIAPTLEKPRPEAPEPGTPPPWSTPDTAATAPPIGGTDTPSPNHPRPPSPGQHQPSTGPSTSAGPPPGPHPPTPPGGSVPPYPPGPPLPPPKPGGRLPLILGIIAVLLICCCAAVVTSLLTWGGDAYDQIRNRTRQTIGLDEPGRDDKLELRMRAVECAVDRIGNPFVSQAPVGQFCLVQVTVRNIGDRPAAVSESLQEAYGPAGKRFVADGAAVLLATPSSPSSSPTSTWATR